MFYLTQYSQNIAISTCDSWTNPYVCSTLCFYTVHPRANSSQGMSQSSQLPSPTAYRLQGCPISSFSLCLWLTATQGRSCHLETQPLSARETGPTHGPHVSPVGSTELLLLAGADLWPASRTERKHGHCQRRRAGSPLGTRPESIKALRDKSHPLQPTGLQERHGCLRCKRSQVPQDTFPSDTGYYGASLSVGPSLLSL